MNNGHIGNMGEMNDTHECYAIDLAVHTALGRTSSFFSPGPEH